MGLDDGVPEESVARVGRDGGRKDTSREVGAAECRVEGDELGGKEGVGRVAGGDDDGVAAEEGVEVGDWGGEEDAESEERGRGKGKRRKAKKGWERREVLRQKPWPPKEHHAKGLGVTHLLSAF